MTENKFNPEQWFKTQQKKLDKVSEIYNFPIAKVFFISPEQITKANKLIKAHEKEKHKGKTPYAGATGGAYSYTFSETGLGQTQGIRCMCGEYLCLTNFENW